MDRLERIDSTPDMLLAALQGLQSDVWTALPGIIQSFDPVAMTCQVQPAIRFRISDPALNTYASDTLQRDPGGQFAWDQMPLLLDCPVVFPGGGGVTLTFPIAVGDEVLVVFASRCIDAWWQQGGIQNQAAFRMHDLSDGFVIPQVRSQPRKFTVSTGAAQLRTDDGTVVIELNPTTHAVNITTTGAVAVSSGGNSSVTAGGNATVTASGTATVQAASIILKNAGSALKKLVNETFITFFNSHVHSNGNGGANTGAPTTAPASTTTTSTVQAE